MRTLLDRQHHEQGFSLLELVVAVSIVLILGSVALISYDTLTANARDAQRIKHANEIAMGLQLYAEDHGHVIGSNSGCGHVGTGVGWFNRGGPSDPEPIEGTSQEGQYGGEQYTSIMDCMVQAGVLSGVMIDPSNRSYISGEGRNRHAYLKYNCAAGNTPKEALIFVKLENVNEEDRMEPDFKCTDGDHEQRMRNHYNRYDMNYWVKAEAL